MKKCVSICKLHTILEVAPSKKNRCLREKALSIQARISVKNRVKIGPDSDSERQRHQKPTKIACDAVSERTFSAPGAIFGDFGGPRWEAKCIKMRLKKRLQKKLKKNRWDALGRRHALGQREGGEGCISMHNPPGLLQKIAICKAFSTPLP